MLLWRLSKKKWAATPLDGEGPRLVGGRWNSPGRRMVYLSEHLSLAVLEVLAHSPRFLVPDHVAIGVEVPDEIAIPRLEDVANLPGDWRETEPPSSTMKLGDDWLTSGRESILSVPSVIVPEERNYLLNPAHPGFASIKVVSTQAFTFDPRLFRA